MTREQAEKFAEDFNRAFKPPFMPEGFVRCSTFERDGKISISFDIGDRNVAFDAEQMEWYAQGTKCEDPEWLVCRPDWLAEQIKQAVEAEAA